MFWFFLRKSWDILAGPALNLYEIAALFHKNGWLYQGFGVSIQFYIGCSGHTRPEDPAKFIVLIIQNIHISG